MPDHSDIDGKPEVVDFDFNNEEKLSILFQI